MMTASHSETYETRDLTLASWLVYNGYSYLLERRGESDVGHPVGVWVFAADGNDESMLREDVRDFAQGEASVEPERFQRTLTKTRRELYDFLGLSRG